ncbi:MAG: hypothetical protein ACK5PW_22280 [Burkholderiales bacterium]|jgi:hypothetical protein
MSGFGIGRVFGAIASAVMPGQTNKSGTEGIFSRLLGMFQKPVGLVGLLAGGPVAAAFFALDAVTSFVPRSKP